MFASYSSHNFPVLAGPRLAVNQKFLLVCLCPPGPPFYIILKGLSACTLEPLRKDKKIRGPMVLTRPTDPRSLDDAQTIPVHLILLYVSSKDQGSVLFFLYQFYSIIF